MIVKDLRKEFYPVPKSGQKKIKQDSKKEHKKDFCIMPKNNSYSTVRTEVYCERHEVYFSKAYRQKSIDDGLIVFLTRKSHRGTNGVHGKNGDKLNRKLKKLAEKAWTSYYNKTKEEFIARYSRNYLD